MTLNEHNILLFTNSVTVWRSNWEHWRPSWIVDRHVSDLFCGNFWAHCIPVCCLR